MKMVTLPQASKILGISVITLRRRIYARSIPYTRSNADKAGKILLDIELVQQVLRNESIANLGTSKGFVDPEPVIDYDPSFGNKEKGSTTMATVSQLFGEITHEDIELGRFSPDTFAFRTTDEPTSETLSNKAPQTL